MRKLWISISSILLLAFLVGLGTACMAVLAEDDSGPTVSTDKRDYTPGETVQIRGSDFAATAELTVRVTRPDAAVDSAAITTEGDGTFQYDYALDGIVGLYTVDVLDGAGTVLATTTFTDGNVKVLPGPSTVTFTLTKTVYSTTNCSGTVKSGPTSATVSSPSGDTTGVGSTESVKLQAAATSGQGGAFIHWTSSDAFTNLDYWTICVLGFKPGGFHDYTANYSTAPPDLCPDDPNKTEPGICGCGIPDTDSDGDTVADCIDECPADPLKTTPGICGCGVADTDSDQDGTPDCNDGCPADPNKTAPGICGCGVADTDSDQDGTPDCNDLCPADPLKTAPGICGCGVADTDSDGDTTADCIDLCPADPLKTAPGVCGCGTPDTDTDGDTVADCIDNCPAVGNSGQQDCNNNGVGDACDAINPGADDSDCDGVDDDCDGTADDDYVPTATTCGVGECADTGELICQGGQQVNTCEEGAPTAEVCDGLDNDCDGSVDEDHVCEADLEKIELFASPFGQPEVPLPRDFTVGEETGFHLWDKVRNNGPVGPAPAVITTTVTAPDGVKLSYHEWWELEYDVQVFLDEGSGFVDVTCGHSCCFHYADPGETLKVLKFMDMPVTAEPLLVPQGWDIQCLEPSNHEIHWENSIALTDEELEDPDPNNNTADLYLPIECWADVDMDVSQEVYLWAGGDCTGTLPTEIDVSEDLDVCVKKTITADVLNNTPYDIPSVHVLATKTAASLDDGCTILPVNPQPEQVEVFTDARGGVLKERFTIHCTKPSTHRFTITNVVSGPKDPHINGDGDQDVLPFSLDALAEVDVAVSQKIVSPPLPLEIDVDADVVITVEKTITATVLNQQPYNLPTVAVTVTKTASAPPDCSVVAPAAVQKPVPTTGSLVYNETLTIRCSKASTHGPFTFNNAVSGPKDAHVTDPNLPNTASTILTVDAIGHADMKVVTQYVENPPAAIALSEDVPIVLKKVIHNDGPYAPVEATTTTTVTAPADCPVNPMVHTQQFYNVPVSVDILHNEPFTIHCSKLGRYTFTFADTVGLKDPHVHDHGPGTNTATTELIVNSVSQADVKIVSASFVDPPAKVDYGVPTNITLRKVIRNNGPWAPVDIAITATATAPTGCTVALSSIVPTSLTNVPVGVDQVVNEVWTVTCTSTGLKSFGFDNLIAVATPFVSDPYPTNNISHRELVVSDDLDSGADNDGDGVLNGVDNCALSYNPGQADADGDGVGDACDTGDSDADVFSDAVEVYLGTDPADNCPDVVGADDAWPLDMNKDKRLMVVGDVTTFSGKIGKSVGEYPEVKRLDLSADGRIMVVGDVTRYSGMIGRSCI